MSTVIASRADSSPAQTTTLASNKELAAQIAAALPGMRRRAIALCRSPQEADDIVQDAVVRALRFHSTFVSGTNLSAWLSQIVFSVFITHCRRRRRERHAMEILSGDPLAWTHPEPSAMAIALSPPVRAALEELPEHFRSVLSLVDLGERPYKDAATELGVPVGTVMSRLHRGRKLLAQRLTEPELAAA